MPAAAVSARGLTKHFGDVHAVDELDLDIVDGEFFSMLGPSGSGKTTVLRLIAGFESPTAGRVLLGDDDVTDLPPHRRDVNTVFQDYAIFPHMDVLTNVEYGLRVKKVERKERRRRAEEALAAVRLEGYGARRPNQLSGGQRQRVALARALVNRPKVLLLDEPLGALDLKLRREMQLELKQIQRDVGVTFVFVTHDQEEALSMSDRVAVFNEGKVEQVATPVELYESPASPFVAGFVGTSNRIGGEAARAILGADGEFAVRPEKLRVAAPGRGPRLRRGGRPAAASARWSTSAPAPTPSSSSTPAHVSPCRGPTAAPPPALRWRSRTVRSRWSSTAAPSSLSRDPPTQPRRSHEHAHATPCRDPRSSSPHPGGRSAAPKDRPRPAPRPRAVRFTPPDVPMQQSMGATEGSVNILAWPGYAEDGSTDKSIDWVTPFEKKTGCQANVKYFGTSDEAVTLMKTGDYDVVSASGDASLRLVASGDVAPVNTVADQGLRPDRALPQGPGLEQRQRPDVRRAPRLGRQPADVPDRPGEAGADQLGGRLHATRRTTRAR